MLEVLVRNADGNVSEKDREYAAKKLAKLGRYFHSASKVELVHREEGKGSLPQHRIELTVHADGIFFRSEESDANVRAAIDKAAERIERKLRQFKKRLIDRHRKRGQVIPPAFEEVHEDETHDHAPTIAERKAFLTKPISIEEAALQLEMIDHSFFVFRNEDSNQIEVLYRRKDGKYGLLQPE